MSTHQTLEVIRKTREYLNYIENHILNVNKAWEIAQVKWAGHELPVIYDDYCYCQTDALVKAHDLSKLSEEEFIAYRMNFYPTELERKDEELQSQVDKKFRAAWEHHAKSNPHHLRTESKTPHLEEFVLDLIAMSMSFPDNGNALEYYQRNRDEWSLDKEGDKYVTKLMMLYYDLDKKTQK